MRKTNAISILVISLLCSFTLFEKKIGTPDCYDEGISVVNNADGSFIISGAYNCSGNNSGWESYLLKMDQNGDTLWTKKNTGTNGIAKKTRDNNLIFAGADKAGFVNDTIKIFKTAENGNIIWSSTIFYPLCKNLATDIFETTDGFLVSGIFAFSSCSNPTFDSFIMKLDSDGNKVWEKVVSGPGNDQLFQVKELSNGDVAAFGWTNSKTKNSDADFLLIKLDRDGNTNWEKTYGDANNNFGYGMEISETNGFILTGYSNQTEIFKIDNNGGVIWNKFYGQACGGRYFKSKLTLDGGYVFLGSENNSGNCGSYLMKTNTDGDVAWKKNFPGKLRDLAEDEKGAFILTGYIDYLPDVYIVKFDSTLLKTIQKPMNISNEEMKKLKEASIVTSNEKTDIQEEIFSNPIVYPNPANERVTIEFPNHFKSKYQLEVFDVNGKIVISQAGNENGKIVVMKKNLSSGMFSFKLLMDEKIHYGKFLFQ